MFQWVDLISHSTSTNFGIVYTHASHQPSYHEFMEYRTTYRRNRSVRLRKKSCWDVRLTYRNVSTRLGLMVSFKKAALHFFHIKCSICRKRGNLFNSDAVKTIQVSLIYVFCLIRPMSSGSALNISKSTKVLGFFKDLLSYIDFQQFLLLYILGFRIFCFGRSWWR